MLMTIKETTLAETAGLVNNSELNAPDKMEEHTSTLGIMYAVKHKKLYFIGGYGEKDQRMFIARLEGPYHISVIGFRPYYNQMIQYNSRSAISEKDALERLERVFGEIKQNPKLRLDRILSSVEWEQSFGTWDMSNQLFLSMITPVERFSPPSSCVTLSYTFFPKEENL